MPSSSSKSSRLRSMPAAVPCEVCQGNPTGSAEIEGCRCMDLPYLCRGHICAHGHHTGFSVGGSLPPWGAAGERSEFNIKPPLGAPLLIFPWGYLLKSFPQVDTSARQQGFEIRVFPLLGELPKAIEPHLPVFQLYRWQLGPNMWSSPTTKSLDPIVVTALRVGFPGESHGPATCGFACNCPKPEAWTTEASGQYLGIGW